MTTDTHNYASFELMLISELVDIADVLASGWVFRGQANTEWDLKTSQEREIEQHYNISDNKTGEWLRNNIQSENENSILKAVKSSVGYISEAERPTDGFSWLALLQHHGCRTRLVDFTESFYIALYFAVRNCPDTTAAVWAISTNGMDAKVRSICEQCDNELSEEQTPRRLVNNSIELPDRYKNDDRLAVVYGKPERLNLRLIAQQGLFLCSLNLDKDFMENLTVGLDLTGEKEKPKRLKNLEELKEESKTGKVIKIRIPKLEHRNLLFHLRKMNINEATLFPGLDGFARSLNYFAIGMA